MKVKDIMIKDIIHLSPQMSAKDAIRKLVDMRISGLPVIDKNHRLIGMFTEKDVLKYALPGYIERVGKFIYSDDPKNIKRKLSELGNIKVEDLMRKEVVTVDEETTLAEVARIMLVDKVRRIPVVKNGQVVGIISREDIVREYLKDTGIIDEK